MNDSKILLLFAIFIATALASACGRFVPKKDHGGHGDDHASVPDNKEADSTNVVIGGFRGYDVTNRLVNERLFSHDGAVALSDYLDGVDKTNPLGAVMTATSSLKDLLGVYDGDGLHTDMKNDLPNGVNMLLWYIAIDGLANELASTCSTPPKPPMFSQADVKDEVHAAIMDLCNWPSAAAAAAAQDEQKLRNIWDLSLQADAPEAEFDSWLAYVQGSSFHQVGAEAVRTMLVTMLYNPNFLLSK